MSLSTRLDAVVEINGLPCSEHLSVTSEEALRTLIRQKRGGFEIHIRHTAFYPQDLPRMQRNADPKVFYVDPFGTVFKPKDFVLFGPNDRLIANLEFMNEDSLIQDQFGNQVRLGSIRFMTQYHGVHKTADGWVPLAGRTQIRGQNAVNFARAQVDGQGRLLAQQSDDVIPGMLDLLAKDNLRALASGYEDSSLPTAAWNDLQLQEFGLASYRTFEVFIMHGPKLAAYLRFYDGTQNIPDEMERYNGKTPVVALEYLGKPIGEVPTYLLPAERIMSDPNGASNPINAFRNDPKYRGFRFLEVGRAFLNYAELNEEQVLQARQMMFTAAEHLLTTLDPEVPPERQLLFASGRKAAVRHYEHEYGFTRLPNAQFGREDLRSIHEQTLLADNIAINLRFADSLKKDQSIDHESFNKPIFILGTTSDKWLANLRSKGLLLANSERSTWSFFPEDPQLMFAQFLSGNPF